MSALVQRRKSCTTRRGTLPVWPFLETLTWGNMYSLSLPWRKNMTSLTYILGDLGGGTFLVVVIRDPFRHRLGMSSESES